MSCSAPFPLELLQCDANMKAFGPILPRPEPQRCLEDSDLAIYRAEGAYRLQRGNQDAPEVGLDLRCLSVLLAGTLLLLTN
jgi:hypothetical protein